MTRRRRGHLHRSCVALRARLVAGIRRAWSAFAPQRPPPVEVLVVDRARRRALARAIRAALARLERALGAPLPDCTAVVVQQVLAREHTLTGCCHLGERPDGTPYALVRLALEVDGRQLSTDEVLAALVEQCCALLDRRARRPGVLVPLEPAPPRAAAEEPEWPRPDPLAPAAGGGGGRTVAW